MKNTIIHPTDFSECANNALTHAIILAKNLNYQLEIVHLLDVDDLNSYERNVRRAIEEIEIIEKEAANKLKKLEVEAQTHGIQCKTAIHSGKIKSLLPKYIVKQNPALIVMGTTGANNMANKIMGSNTYAIIEETKFPVLAVPEKAILKNFKTLTFLSDYKDKDVNSMVFLSKIAECFNSTIEVTHVLNDEASKKVNNQKLLDNFQLTIEKEISYKNINYQLLYGNDTLLRIRILIKETMPDIVALVMRKQSFLERLFLGSLTEKMVYQTETPLLIFPE